MLKQSDIYVRSLPGQPLLIEAGVRVTARQAVPYHQTTVDQMANQLVANNLRQSVVDYVYGETYHTLCKHVHRLKCVVQPGADPLTETLAELQALRDQLGELFHETPTPTTGTHHPPGPIFGEPSPSRPSV